jgi:hypothetical protein
VYANATYVSPQGAFELYTPSQVVYLRAASDAEMEDWVWALAECGVLLRAASRAFLARRASTVTALRAVTKQGYLWRRASGERRWPALPSFFRVDTFAKLLSECDSYLSLRAAQSISLRDSVVRPTRASDAEGDERAFVVEVSERLVLFLRADSVEERDEWLNVLEYVQAHELSVEPNAPLRLRMLSVEAEGKERSRHGAAPAPAPAPAQPAPNAASEEKAAPDSPAAPAGTRAEALQLLRLTEHCSRGEVQRAFRQQTAALQSAVAVLLGAAEAHSLAARARALSVETPAASERHSPRGEPAAEAESEARAAQRAGVGGGGGGGGGGGSGQRVRFSLPHPSAGLMLLNEEDLFLIGTGTEMTKLPFGRLGRPRVTTVFLVPNKAGEYLVQWESKKPLRECTLYIKDCQLRMGQQTATFRRFAGEIANRADLSFSLLTAARTLDLVCHSLADFRRWVGALQSLVQRHGMYISNEIVKELL